MELFRMTPKNWSRLGESKASPLNIPVGKEGLIQQNFVVIFFITFLLLVFLIIVIFVVNIEPWRCRFNRKVSCGKIFLKAIKNISSLSSSSASSIAWTADNCADGGREGHAEGSEGGHVDVNSSVVESYGGKYRR